MNDNEKLRKLQETCLSIMKDVDSFCRKHNIRYSLAYGTLLGAVRHQGFIPWDDDLDICMRRDQYEKFISLWLKEKPEGYFLQNKDTDPAFPQSFTKIRKENTVFLQINDKPGEFHQGIFIDIFPIDRVPSNYLLKMDYYWKSMKNFVYTREFVPKEGRLAKAAANVLLKTTKPGERAAKRKAYINEIRNTNYNDKYALVDASILSGMLREYPSDLMDEYTELPFEGQSFMCIKKWDSFLRIRYGDYNTLPPKEERTWKHPPVILDFSRSYEEMKNLTAEPIRVLHVIRLLNHGGAESMIMNLYRKIDRTKIQFDFVETSDEKGLYEDDIISMGGRIFHCLPFTGGNIRKYGEWWDTFFAEHKNEYAFVHGHIGSTAAIYLSAAKKYGIKTIAHSHNTYSGFSPKQTVYQLFSYPTRYIADYFFACSNQAAVSRFGRKVNYHVLRNAIDTEKFKYTGKTYLPLTEGRTVYGHIGQFRKQKNHAFLLKVFESIHRKDPDTVLLLTGDGPLRQELEDNIERSSLSDAVFFLGSRNDIPDILNCMDFMIFPSFYEGIPVTLIEAQCSGMRCLVSDHISDEAIVVPELITKMPLTASAEEWAEKAIGLSRYHRVSGDRETAEHGFDVIRNAEWLESFYLKEGSGDE